MRPTTSIGAPFALTDHHGRAVTDRSFAGRHLLVFFGFTHCRRVCPERLATLSAALAALGPLAGRIQPLYVTVDPGRDDSARMRAFLEDQFPLFTGLTGDPSALADLRVAYKVFAQRDIDDLPGGGYDVPHSAMTFVMGPDGDYVTHFSDASTAEAITAGLRRVLA